MKNFKDIVNHFDVVEKVYTHSSENILVVLGQKDNKLTNIKTRYNNRKVMLEVAEKVSYFIDIK